MTVAVTANVSGLKNLTITHIRTCLEKAGLEGRWVRELLPRYAWARAVAELKKGKVIHPFNEDGDTITFQFNGVIVKDGESVEYPREAILKLDKKTGKVTCISKEDGGKELARLVGERVADETGKRAAKDITRLIHRAARAGGLLLNGWNRGSGIFLVTEDRHGTLDKIDAFLQTLEPGRRLQRLALKDGDAATEATITDVVSEGMDDLVREMEERTTEILEARERKIRPETLRKKIEELQEVKLRIDAASQYLADTRSNLLARLETVKAKIQSKMKAPAPAAATEVPAA